MKKFYSAFMLLLLCFPKGMHGQSLLPPVSQVSGNGMYSGFTSLKNIQEEVQKPDSTLQENWVDSTSQWVTAGKRVNTYNAYGQIILDLAYWWDETAGMWVFRYKNDYTWNEGSKLLSVASFLWDEIRGTWYGGSRHDYTYDDHGNKATVISFDWDPNAEDWIYYNKEEYNYDAEGKLASLTAWKWNISPDQWFMDFKMDHAYDQNGNDTLINLYTIDPDNGALAVSEIMKYGYDENGFRVSFLEVIRPDSVTGWINNYRSEYTNDATGNLILSVQYYWNEITGEWLANIKESYDYDAAGHVTLYKEYLNNDSPVNWDSTLIIEQTYDEYGNLKVETFHGKSAFTGVWNVSRNINFYSVYDITQVPSIPDPPVSVYPNPASEYILFDLEGSPESAIVEMFNSQGRQVLKRRIFGSEPVTVNQLAKGIYMYTVTYGKKIYSGKVLIQ
jgi:hypothetical protein